MAQITAAMVKELREMTGAGMMECKKALTEADGDMDGAVDVLRTRGLAAAAKKAGRATNEGRVVALVCEDNATVGSVCQVNCETDFVALTDKFQAYAENFTKAVAVNNPASVEELLESEFEGEKVQDALTEAIHVIGENMQIANFKRLEVSGTGALVPYIHMNGKIGVLVAFSFNNEATAAAPAFTQMGKDVAMQIAATSPVSLDETSVPEEIREHEMAIYKAQAAESGKPEAIQEKIATGRMQKFYKENCLVDQDFVKDPDQTVASYIAGVAKELGDEIKVVDFARIALGD
ncbi:elongation factor Ts [Denitrobacterium detoxificans]|uniref:Elongation factor Ts n=1 Tax=Denitrobacterium detoxificans TaxID=79604 RepID=A0A172RZJ4_9ACTN|nr:translation elongation factor Ts [Denitrobacterium detoxificans]ANE23102.1 elongation factor Ts [Denitrobacterium detoxificans]SEO53136.1 elongation factor Ts [Denitrobacterium detoxificans]